MSADPLIDDSDASVLVQLQLLPRGLKPHHFRQQLPQFFLFWEAKERLLTLQNEPARCGGSQGMPTPAQQSTVVGVGVAGGKRGGERPDQAWT